MTMVTFLSITSENDPAFLEEVARAIKEAGIEIQDKARVRDVLPLPVDIVVALSSAGVFTTLYQVLAKLLEREKNQGREVQIESKYGKIILKNHSFAEEKEFIERLAPKGIGGETTKQTQP